MINHTDKSERVLLWGWYCWVNVLADRRFGIELLETEVLSETEEDPELHQYPYRKVERQLRKDKPEVIIDIPGADNPKKLVEYPGLMKWVAEHYKAQPFMKGTLYRRL